MNWKKSKIPLFALMLMVALCTVTGCGSEADISVYAEEEITLIGLMDAPIVVTVAELSALESDTQSAGANTQKASDVKVTGPRLATIASEYGRSLEEFFMVKVIAADGFQKKFRGEELMEANAILGFSNDGEPLDEDHAPAYLVLPSGSSGDWVRMVKSIEFVAE